jgi:hypothetical protein
MTASGARKPSIAADKPVLLVVKSIFSTGLSVPGGEIRPDLGGAHRNHPVHRERWRQGWGIQLPTFGGLKPGGITAKPVGNTDLSITVDSKPIRRCSGGKRPNPAAAARWEGGMGAKWPFGGEGKILGLPPYKEPVDFCFSSVFLRIHRRRIL